ncbi:MAG: helix-turn-helix transcriptional regulator [Methylibium sp.]|nr:helix-turn-helix transcriptional regulator [Methylibium sp.]MBA3596664.1 helix-turn-helix transcriptional regulator [Methylibium sp.]
MPAPQPALFPSLNRLLAGFGERLRVARLRRHMTLEQVCARADVSRMTLYRAESGNSAVSLGTYLRILAVLKLENDLELVARDDTLGRMLQDQEIPERRAPRRRKTDSEDSGEPPRGDPGSA